MNTTPIELKYGYRYTYATGGISAPLVRSSSGGFCDPARGLVVHAAEFTAEHPPAPVQLELGKRYVCWDGSVTRPLVRTPDSSTHHDTHPYLAPNQDSNQGLGRTYTPSGVWTAKGTRSVWDLVAEYTQSAGTLRLEVGKYYKTAGGVLFGPVKRRTSSADGIGFSAEIFPFSAASVAGGPDHAYREDGSWSTVFGECTPLYDLVAEHVEPAKPVFQLELGKRYLSRAGIVYGPVVATELGVNTTEEDFPSQFPYAAREQGPSSVWEHYRADGSWGLQRGFPSSYDLVAEHVEPTTPPTPPTPPTPSIPPAASQLVADYTAFVESVLQQRAHDAATRFVEDLTKLDKSALRTIDWSALSRVEPGVDFRLVLRDLIVAASRANYLDEAFRDAHKTLQIPLASPKPPV